MVRRECEWACDAGRDETRRARGGPGRRQNKLRDVETGGGGEEGACRRADTCVRERSFGSGGRGGGTEPKYEGGRRRHSYLAGALAGVGFDARRTAKVLGIRAYLIPPSKRGACKREIPNFYWFRNPNDRENSREYKYARKLKHRRWISNMHIFHFYSTEGVT